MARYKSYRRNDIKNILTTIVSLVLIIAAVAGVGVLFTRETKRISPTVFEVGAMNQNGEYVKVTNSIYTKQFQECIGLMIEPDFETKGTFEVFYYDSEKQFLGTTGVLNAIDGVYSKGNTYKFAKYCRIVITPEIEEDPDSDVVEETEIRFWETAKYASQYKIVIDRKQDFAYRISEFDSSIKTVGRKWDISSGSIEKVIEANSACYDPFSVKGEKLSCVLFAEEYTAGSITMIFVNKDGAHIETTMISASEQMVHEDGCYFVDDIAIPEGAVKCYVTTSIDKVDMDIYFK